MDEKPRKIDATLTDLLTLQIRLTSITAQLLDRANVVSRQEFGDELKRYAGALPAGVVKDLIEALADGVGPEPPPRFEVIEGGKE